MLKMGTSGPTAICDWCCKEIRAGGLVLYNEDGRLAFTHEDCADSLKFYNVGVWNAMPLKQFLLDLLKGA